MSKRIAKNIQVLRTNYHISQAKLAELLGYEGPETVCRWEKGSRVPNVDALAKLSEIFKITLDDLTNSDLSLNPKMLRGLEVLPKDKLLSILCNLDLPICDIDASDLAEQLDESASNNEDLDEEEKIVEDIRAFGEAYGLDTKRMFFSSREIDQHIEKLYVAAYRNGEGIIEAGVNLARLWIIQDINARKDNQLATHIGEILELLYSIEDYVNCSLILPIIDFYKALMKVCWVYLDNLSENSEFVEEAQQFADSGYEEMAILAEKYRNPYALDFLSTVSNDVAEAAREKLKTMTLDEYLGYDVNNLSDEDKALIEEFKEAEEWHKAIDEAMGL